MEFNVRWVPINWKPEPKLGTSLIFQMSILASLLIYLINLPKYMLLKRNKENLWNQYGIYVKIFWECIHIVHLNIYTRNMFMPLSQSLNYVNETLKGLTNCENFLSWYQKLQIQNKSLCNRWRFCEFGILIQIFEIRNNFRGLFILVIDLLKIKENTLHFLI